MKKLFLLIAMGIISFAQTTLAKEIQITSNSKDQGVSAISGNTIVWTDGRNGNWDIYARTINSDGTLGEEKQITTDNGVQECPAISAVIDRKSVV